MVVTQFTSDMAVNELFEFSKTLIDETYYWDNVPRDFKTLQYIIFAGMISYYGFEHIEEVAEVFNKVNFIFTREKMGDFLRKQPGLDRSTVEQLVKVGANAVFWQDIDFEGIQVKSAREKIYASSYGNYSIAQQLEFLAHEVNHAVNSVNRKLFLENGRKYTRFGLCVNDVDQKLKKNLYLEESFNVLQTGEIMDHILALSQYDIKDPNIRKTLNSMKKDLQNRRISSYTRTTPLVKPLYDDRHFNYVLKNRKIEGYISDISDEFNCRVGSGSFDEMSNCLDKIYSDNTGSSARRASNIVRQYVRS